MTDLVPSSDDWCTPAWLTELLGRFDLDPCSNTRSTVRVTNSFSPDWGRDGLTLEWGVSSVFVNPPYSNPLPWCQRLAAHRGPWVALVKLDPTTKWWATLMRPCSRVSEWAGFRKRLKFERPDKPPLGANFPSALVWSRWELPDALVPHLWV